MAAESQNQLANPPIVAILTIDDQEKTFRGNRQNFIDLIETGKSMGILVYVTTIHHLKLHTNKILGYTYNLESKDWERRFFTVPQVIYNRIPQREDEWSPEVRSKLDECIKHPNIQLFNPGFFNKWILFKWLSKNIKTKRFVPVTKRYKDELNLLPLLKRYPFLYLKPEKGKAGMGIMRVSRLPTQKQRYAIDIQEKHGNHIYQYSTQSKLKIKIREYAGAEDYIIQQGISLLSCNQRPFDLRVLVQKNKKGVWSVTGIGARQAGILSITTHVPRGGTVEDPFRLLTDSLNRTMAKQILLRVKKTAVIIAKQIERASGSELGELSLDLGIDKSARLWFFEANSKPMKFDEPHIRKKSLIKLLQYSTFLAKKAGRTDQTLNRRR